MHNHTYRVYERNMDDIWIAVGSIVNSFNEAEALRIMREKNNPSGKYIVVRET